MKTVLEIFQIQTGGHENFTEALTSETTNVLKEIRAALAGEVFEGRKRKDSPAI